MLGDHGRLPAALHTRAQRVMKGLDTRAIEVAQRTDVGKLREANEDACGHSEVLGNGCLLFVADGMGGHAGGATASRLAVETLAREFPKDAGDPGRALGAGMESVNRRVFEEARRNPELHGMGTTGVALLFAPEGRAYVANVGDSRAYRLRNGELAQLTSDHSLVAELVRRDVLTEEQARVHPRRNELLRSLGVDGEVEIDLECFEVEPGDCYLLCSDGLCGVLRDAEIQALLEESSPAEAAERLVDAANDAGGPDNVTVMIARVPI